MEAQEHKRRRNAADAEEVRPDSYGLAIRDEQPHDVRGEQLVHQDARCADGQPHPTGETDDPPHPAEVPGRVVVGRDGHHPLTYPDADVEGQTLRLEDDPDGREGDIAVPRGELVNDDIGEVEQERSHSGRDTDGEDLPDLSPPGQARQRGEGQGARRIRRPPLARDAPNVIDADEHVGQHRGHARAHGLQPRGKQHEHE